MQAVAQHARGAFPEGCLVVPFSNPLGMYVHHTCIIEVLLCDVRKLSILNLGVKLCVPEYPLCYSAQETGAVANFVEDVSGVVGSW